MSVYKACVAPGTARGGYIRVQASSAATAMNPGFTSFASCAASPCGAYASSTCPYAMASASQLSITTAVAVTASAIIMM